jgi:hypothetical protein
MLKPAISSKRQWDEEVHIYSINSPIQGLCWQCVKSMVSTQKKLSSARALGARWVSNSRNSFSRPNSKKKFIFETGTQTGSIDGKTRGRKSHATVPLKRLQTHISTSPPLPFSPSFIISSIYPPLFLTSRLTSFFSFFRLCPASLLSTCAEIQGKDVDARV